MIARRSGVLGGIAVLAVLLAGALPTDVTRSVASWRDGEHTRAALGTVDCTKNSFNASATSRLVSGTALASGDIPSATMTATAAGAAQSASRADATAVSGGYQHSIDRSSLAPAMGPLVVTAPSAFSASGWTKATGDAVMSASSGVLSSDGAIDGGAVAAASARWMNVSLSGLVAQATGAQLSAAVAGVTSLDLLTGGLASSAGHDACTALWTSAPESRDYRVGAMTYELASPLVSTLTASVSTARADLIAGVAAAATDKTLVDSVTGALDNLIRGLIGGLGLGTTKTSITASIGPADLAALDALLRATAQDPNGLVTVDFGAGTVRIDAAKLHGFLNARAPNSPLVIGPGEATAITAAVTAAVAAWAASVATALDAAVDSVKISSTTTFTLLLLGAPLATVVTQVVAAPLGSLRTGATVARMQPGPGLLSGLVALLDSALTSPTSGAGVVVANLLRSTLTLTYSGFLPASATTATSLGAAAANAMSLVLGPNGIAAVVVNAQNRPRSGANPVPAALAALPIGRFDVGAVRIQVRAATGVASGWVGRWLMLAGASVGPAALR